MSFARKAKRNAKNPLMERQKIISKAKKQSEKIYAMAKLAIDKIHDSIIAATCCINTVCAVHVLRVHENFTKPMVEKFLNRYSFNVDCTNEHRINIDDVRNLVIRGDDPENYPLKWKDYLYPYHHVEDFIHLMPEAKTDRDIYYNIINAEGYHLAEEAHSYCETNVLLCLRDVFHFGIKRAKRVVEELRKYEYATADRINDVIDMVKVLNVVEDIEGIRSMRQYWIAGLKPAGWRELL